MQPDTVDGLLEDLERQRRAGEGAGGEDPGKHAVHGSRGESFSAFFFSPVLTLRQALRRAVSTIAENQGEFHLFNQKTRKMQAGEYGGRSPPPLESWVNGTGSAGQGHLWRARLAGGAGS